LRAAKEVIGAVGTLNFGSGFDGHVRGGFYTGHRSVEALPTRQLANTACIIVVWGQYMRVFREEAKAKSKSKKQHRRYSALVWSDLCDTQ
jgi:hypothetical protein